MPPPPTGRVARQTPTRRGLIGKYKTTVREHFIAPRGTNGRCEQRPSDLIKVEHSFNIAEPFERNPAFDYEVKVILPSPGYAPG